METNNGNLTRALRVVVKLGTSTLTNGTAYLSQPRMAELVRQLAEIRQHDVEILLVSSGAIAMGRQILDFPQLPKDIPQKQMLAAVGQPSLMDIWGKLFGIYDLRVAQVLLTRSDLRARPRYLNARNTLLALLHQGLIPVINENDTVATEEIRVGDNDNLSALVANLVDADLLALLTDQDGLYRTDPRTDPSAQLIPLVDSPEIEPALWEAAGGSGEMGVGGMVTKLQAADLARRSGVQVVIANGSQPQVLNKIVSKQAVGTRFTATTSSVESRKRYILSGGQQGTLVVDDGAVAAIRRGGSLLPAGIVKIVGQFDRGATLSISKRDGEEVARGMVNYNDSDCQRLLGRHSSEIAAVLGYFYGDEIIHRNNLVLL